MAVKIGGGCNHRIGLFDMILQMCIRDRCKAPASKFNEMAETAGGLEFADQHVIGVAKGCDEEMIKDLNHHFMGECTDCLLYTSMSLPVR